jgi:hypothetical protein
MSMRELVKQPATVAVSGWDLEKELAAGELNSWVQHMIASGMKSNKKKPHSSRSNSTRLRLEFI